ncbi:hypothetical protein TIFTF001_010027 [Ficus carica]|uniref:Uncharacterized protein n=1 Tax=Ficus carica TaxID=3494 RepID=A0AA88A7Y3_FICCA|nr:hypothetical protein TIFTF001_010027 [Ficus carica]
MAEHHWKQQRSCRRNEVSRVANLTATMKSPHGALGALVAHTPGAVLQIPPLPVKRFGRMKPYATPSGQGWWEEGTWKREER